MRTTLNPLHGESSPEVRKKKLYYITTIPTCNMTSCEMKPPRPHASAKSDIGPYVQSGRILRNSKVDSKGHLLDEKECRDISVTLSRKKGRPFLFWPFQRLGTLVHTNSSTIGVSYVPFLDIHRSNLLARPPRLGTCHDTHASSSGSSTDPDMTQKKQGLRPFSLHPND
ncbi:hypothetical protein J6590_086588 [Homalodisca vitripennis]|nr:hypothetical protein J6590_086588 [Homalodisca vitripennis]